MGKRKPARRPGSTLYIKNPAAHRLPELPTLDTRSDDEILGYDNFGIPR